MRRWLRYSALGLCGAGHALAGAPAWAQAAPAAAVAQPEAAGYADRVLDDSPQAAQEDEPEARDTGWPRGWSIEGQSTQQRGVVRQNSQSLLFSGYLDTPNYGTFSANANLNRDTAPVNGFGLVGTTGTPYSVVPYSYRSGSTWRVDQRGMPFDGGWFGNNSIGNINMASTPLARGVGRVYLPNLPIEGVAASLEQPGRTTFNASAGRLGYFDGLSFQGFSTGRGTAASAGAQTQLTGGDGPLALGRTDAAVQLIETRDFNANGVPGFAQNTRSLWTAVSWQGLAPWADSLGTGFGGVADKVGGLRVQANLAHSAGRPSDAFSFAPRDSATGGWVDAAWRTELMQQAASVFYFEPSLRWGGDSLPSDLRGASWRGDISTRQWQIGTNIEVSDSVSGLQRSSVFGNLFGRYRFDSRDAVSATLAARTGTFAAQSAQVTWEHKSDWGYTQWRTDAGPRQRPARAAHRRRPCLERERDADASRPRWRSSSRARPGSDRRAVHWGVLGTTPLAAGARLDLSVRGSNGIGDNDARFLSANARLSWPLGLGWSFIAQYTAARGQESLNPAVVSALTRDPAAGARRAVEQNLHGGAALRKPRRPDQRAHRRRTRRGRGPARRPRVLRPGQQRPARGERRRRRQRDGGARPPLRGAHRRPGLLQLPVRGGRQPRDRADPGQPAAALEQRGHAFAPRPGLRARHRVGRFPDPERALKRRLGFAEARFARVLRPKSLALRRAAGCTGRQERPRIPSALHFSVAPPISKRPVVDSTPASPVFSWVPPYVRKRVLAGGLHEKRPHCPAAAAAGLHGRDRRRREQRNRTPELQGGHTARVPRAAGDAGDGRYEYRVWTNKPSVMLNGREYRFNRVGETTLKVPAPPQDLFLIHGL